MLHNCFYTYFLRNQRAQQPKQVGLRAAITTKLRRVRSMLALSLLALTVSTWATSWNAGTTDGTISVGSGGDYNSLGACASAFTSQAGRINANWTVNILSGSYSEAASVLFANTIASGKTVTIKPASGATVSINFTQTTANTSTVDGGIVIGVTNTTSLDSIVATNGLVFDGSNNGGTSRDLTLTNGAPSGFAASIFRIHGSSSNGTIKNITMTNSCTNGGSTYGINFVSRNSASTDYIPNNWTVQNCSITNTAGSAGQGIACNVSGTITSGNAQSGHLFTGNTITARTRGIFLNANASTTITGNTIKINQTATGSYSEGIYHASSNASTAWTISISGNMLNQLATAATGSGAGIAAMDLSGGPTSPKIGTYTVYNNMICGYSCPTGAANDIIYRGIYSGSASINQNFYHNSINMPNFAGVSGGTAGNACAMGSASSSFSGTNNWRNNVVSFLQSGANASALLKGNTTGFTSDYNDVYVNTANFGRYNGSTYTDLAAWKTATSKDSNSQSVDPNASAGSAWTSSSDLHFTTANNVSPNVITAGTAISSVLTDIDGQSRNQLSPYKGCDEILGGGVYTTFGSDSQSNATYSSAWNDSSNGGSGFSPWVQSGAGGSGGFFVGDSRGNGTATPPLDANTDFDINTPATATGKAWGMYANSGNVTEAVRPLSSALRSGDQLRFRIDNGTVQSGGTVGWSLYNANDQILLESYFIGGDTGYKYNDSAGSSFFSSNLAYSAEGLEYSITQTGSSTYQLTVRQLNGNAVRTRSGTLKSPASGTQSIAKVRFFNANAGSGGTADSFFNSISVIDGVSPACAVTPPAATTNANPINFAVTFSESVTGLTAGGISVTGGTAGTLTGSGSSYTLPVTPSGQGTVTVTVPLGAAKDTSSNGSTASNTGSATYDSIAPTAIAKTPFASALVNNVTTVSVTFSESMLGVTAADITVNGSAATSVSGSGAGPYVFSGYTVPVDGTVNVVLGSGSITDTATNSFPGTSWSFSLDSTAPTVSATIPAASAAVNALSSIDVTFSESVTGLIAGNLSVNGSPATAVSGSGAGPYTFSGFTAPAQGTVNAVLSGGAIIDTASNAFAGSSWSFTFDTTAAGVSSVARVSSTPTNAASLDFTVTFSEPVTGVDATEFSVAASGITGSGVTGVAGGGSSYTVTVNTGTGDGTLRLDVLALDNTIKDAAGNALSAGYSAGQSYVVDKTAPAAQIAPVTDATQVTTTVYLDFAADDGSGSGVALTELYVKAPGASVFGASGVTASGANGTLTFPVAIGGRYEFAARATDNAGNQEAEPASAEVVVVVNPSANAALTLDVPGDGAFVFPMTAALDTTITLTGVTTPGTLTVSRATSDTLPAFVAPGYFRVADQLLPESLAISAGGGLTGFTAQLEWAYDPANTPTGGITTVTKFDGGANPAGSFAVTPQSGVLSVSGIVSFSDWYAGNAVAVPVSVSALSIE